MRHWGKTRRSIPFSMKNLAHKTTGRFDVTVSYSLQNTQNQKKLIRIKSSNQHEVYCFNKTLTKRGLNKHNDRGNRHLYEVRAWTIYLIAPVVAFQTNIQRLQLTGTGQLISKWVECFYWNKSLHWCGELTYILDYWSANNMIFLSVYLQWPNGCLSVVTTEAISQDV